MRIEWDWKVPSTHRGQTRLSWWAEQSAAVILVTVAKRAHKRGDTDTFNRIVSIVLTAAQWERTREEDR